MKKPIKVLSRILTLAALLIVSGVYGQTLLGPQGYKVVDLGTNQQGDHTRSVILLHEIYKDVLLPFNNANGTITAYRGSRVSYNRVSSVSINTSSSYNTTSGTMQSWSNDSLWKLKTCIYGGQKYIALEVPYEPAFYDIGFQFAGWANSSSESLKIVNYMVNGQAVNQNLISDIKDFESNMFEIHQVSQMNILGKLNIGTDIPMANYQLQVKGKIRSEEVRVEAVNWPDYVFESSYKLKTLTEVENFIKKNKHLPEVPSAINVTKDGIQLGEMNRILVQKIEELTLYLIEQKKINDQQNDLLEEIRKSLLDKLKN
jgi:hypothetical protein